jgi:lipoprotein signal peptidase
MAAMLTAIEWVRGSFAVAVQTRHYPAVVAATGIRGAHWVWLVVPLAFVAAASLAVDALVREWIPQGQSFWIFRPVLYFAHGQNLDSPEAVALPLGGAAIAFAFVLVRSIQRNSPPASRILELTAALCLGGALANLVEVLATRSVTDFLGIQGSGGIYSAGDVAFDVGVALFPLTAFKVVAPISRRRNALLAVAFAYLVVILIAITNPRTFGVAILATIIVAASSTFLVVRRAGREVRERLPAHEDRRRRRRSSS